MSSPAPTSTNLHLRRQLMELTKKPVEGFSAGACACSLPLRFPGIA
jgi:hypothetical protein